DVGTIAGVIIGKDTNQVIARRELRSAQQSAPRLTIANAVGDDVLESRRRAVSADAAANRIGHRHVLILRRQAVELDVDERLLEARDRRAVGFQELIADAVEAELAAGYVAVDAVVGGDLNLH